MRSSRLASIAPHLIDVSWAGVTGVDVHKVWRVFLLQLAFAREYPAAYRLSSLAVRNPVLESVLPSLLYVKMTAILDDALDEHLDSQSSGLPKGYRQDLNGRICF